VVESESVSICAPRPNLVATHCKIDIVVPHKTAKNSMTFSMSNLLFGELGLWIRTPTEIIDVKERMVLTRMTAS